MTPHPTMDAAERELVSSTLRNVLDTHAPAEVPGGLLREGWASLVDHDPVTALTLLGEQAGRARSAAPVIDIAVAWSLGLVEDVTTAVLIDGLVLAGAERAGRFLDLRADGVVTVGASAVSLTPVVGADPALGLYRASFDETSVTRFADDRAAARAMATARRVLASQIAGTCEQMLLDTLDYVTTRHQYGRAIGSFQSVKHRLADVKVAYTAARAAVATAWEEADEPDGPVLAMAAKSLAGRAQVTASTHCFQVHGAIAFSVEHGFQEWVRRGLLLDHLLGGHERLTREIGRLLLDQRAVPRAPSLA